MGSTSNILDFIVKKTAAAVNKGEKRVLQFVLGTEAGMVTSIVRGVEKVRKTGRQRGREGGEGGGSV